MLARNLLSLMTGLFILLTLASCGKKSKEEKSTRDVNPNPPLESDLEQFLKQQEVICENGKTCPDYLTKIVVVDGDKRKFCTGFLTDSETVATSTNCLSELLRIDDQRCDKEVFFFFPETFSRPAQRVECKKVLKASSIETKDPVLWRNNISFLELKRSVYRRPLIINRDGVQDRKSMVMWAIDQIDNKTGIIRREECEAVHNTYLNPLVTDVSSPNLTFAGCMFKKGNSGAPIVDYRGKLRAMVSTGIDSKVIEYLNSTGLLLKPLKEMFHATNLACAPTIYNTDVLNEQECSKELNYKLVDKVRAEMLSTVSLFKDLLLRFETKLGDSNKYIKLKANLVPDGNIHRLDIYPSCFKNVSQWIGGLSTNRNFSFDITLPTKNFRRAMDTYGKIMAVETDEGELEYSFQFSPKTLRYSRKTNILVWNAGVSRNFQSISEDCGSLLEVSPTFSASGF